MSATTIPVPNSNIKRRVYRNFIRGMQLRGPLDITNTRTASSRTGQDQDGFLAYLKGLGSESGLLEPAPGGLLFNSAAVTAGTGDGDLLSQYTLEHTSSVKTALFCRSGNLDLVRAASMTAAGSIGGSGVFRTASQYRGYAYIAGKSQSLYRIRQNNATAILGTAGTPPPTNTPALARVAGGGALSSFASPGYKMIHAFRYGRNGDLGMGWRASDYLTTIITNDRITISNLSTAVPAGYSDLYGISVFRNTVNYPYRYFLQKDAIISADGIDVTPAASYANLAQSDLTIEGNEEIDPYSGTTLVAGGASSNNPPSAAYCVVHDGRLWLFYLTSGTEMYPCEYAYSRFSGADSAAGPRPDQFDAGARGPVSSGEYGEITGAYSYGGNLFVTMQHGIAYLRDSPVEGGAGQRAKPPGWSVVVAGLGCVAPRSQSSSRWGRFMVSSEGPILFRSGGDIQRIWANMTGAADPADFASAVGGFSPRTQRYYVKLGTTIFSYDVLRESWRVERLAADGYSGFSVCGQVDGDLILHAREDSDNAVDDKLWILGAGTRGTWLTGGSYAPELRTHFDDCDEPGIAKQAVAVNVWSASNDQDFTPSSGAIHFDGESSAAASLTFTAMGNGLVRRATLDGTLKKFETAQVRILSAASATAVCTQVELEYISEPGRRWTA